AATAALNPTPFDGRSLYPRRPRSRRRAFDAGAAFVAAKRPALIPVAERIGRKLGIGRERGGGMLLGAALRPIAEAEGGGVVPPAARIVGCAVEDFVADVAMPQPDAA